MLNRWKALVLVATFFLLDPSWTVWASCGQAVCSLEPRLTEQASVGRGRLRFTFETEYIEQDQPWTRFHAVDVGEVPRSDHDEVETTNVNWRWIAEIGVTDTWSVGLHLPLLYREHLHLASVHHLDIGSGAHNGEEPGDGGDAADDGTVTIGDATGVPERWTFARLGDMRLTASHTTRPAADTEIVLYAGLELPTGETSVRNGAGEEAEITLQPGSGSIDPLFGASIRHRFRLASGTVLPAALGVHVRTEGSDGKFGYRPGTEVLAGAGARYPLFDRLQPALQVNFRYRDRDHVGDAPGVHKKDTGGEALYISPGVWIGLTDRIDANAYVQVPVFQRVNGVQLVSRWNLFAGLTFRLDL